MFKQVPVHVLLGILCGLAGIFTACTNAVPVTAPPQPTQNTAATVAATVEASPTPEPVSTPTASLSPTVELTPTAEGITGNRVPLIATPSTNSHTVADDYPQAWEQADTDSLKGGNENLVSRTEHVQTTTVDATTIVARVNELPITAGRLIETRRRISENLAWMRDILSQIVPEGQANSTLEDELSDPNTLIPESSGLREIFGPRVTLVDSQDIESAALAHLVIRLAIYSEAIEAGYSADPAEIGSLVESNRTDFLYGLRPEMEQHVSTYGFDVFFDEVLTGVITEELTIQGWAQQLTANRKSDEEGANIFKHTKRAIVDAAEVVIVDATAVGTTVEKAVAFAMLDIALDPGPA